jgi:hypothetical protein
VRNRRRASKIKVNQPQEPRTTLRALSWKLPLDEATDNRESWSVTRPVLILFSFLVLRIDKGCPRTDGAGPAGESPYLHEKAAEKSRRRIATTEQAAARLSLCIDISFLAFNHQRVAPRGLRYNGAFRVSRPLRS